MLRIIGRLGVGLVLLLLWGPPPASGHAPGLSLAGRGTATIDGVFRPGEWEPAATYGFGAHFPGSADLPSVLYVMNDASNLYLGVRVTQPQLGFSSVSFAFDGSHNGQLDPREDYIVLNAP